MRRWGRVVVISLAVLVGLAGCAGESGELDAPAEVVAPPVSPAPADSVEAEDPKVPEDPVAVTPEPLPLPEYPDDLTEEDTAANALLAAEYFLELMNYIQSTGDVEPFAAVAAQSCDSCEKFIRLVEDEHENDVFTVGNHAVMENPRVKRTGDGLAWVVTADWQISSGIIFDRKKQHARDVGSATFVDHRLGVQLIDDSWKMLVFAEAEE